MPANTPQAEAFYDATMVRDDDAVDPRLKIVPDAGYMTVSNTVTITGC